MTTHLIHAATMPRAGLYAVTQLDPEAFFSAIEAAHADGQLVNCIAYRGNLDLVFQMTRVDLLEEVRPLELEDGDRILIMRLKYDPRNKPDKRRIVGVQDFIYQRAIYRASLPPIPENLLKLLETWETDTVSWIVDYLVAGHQADRNELEDLIANVHTVAERGGHLIDTNSKEYLQWAIDFDAACENLMETCRKSMHAGTE